MTNTEPERGKTSAKSNSSSYAPQSHTPGDLTLVPDTAPEPARKSTPQLSAADLQKQVELRELLDDLHRELDSRLDGSRRQLIAKHGRVVGVESDVDGATRHAQIPGWHYQTAAGMLVPALDTAAGREWRARISALGVLSEHVDSSAGPGGGTGGISYTVRPIY